MLNIFVVTTCLLFTSMSVLAQAAELPEPVQLVTTEFQILWGGMTPTPQWVNITPKSLTTVAGVANAAHNYLGRIGDNTFESVSWDSTALVPKKIIAVFAIPAIPSNGWFDIFRIRSRYVITVNATVNTTDWSPASYWTLVLNPTKAPSIAVAK